LHEAVGRQPVLRLDLRNWRGRGDDGRVQRSHATHERPQLQQGGGIEVGQLEMHGFRVEKVPPALGRGHNPRTLSRRVPARGGRRERSRLREPKPTSVAPA